MTPGARVSAAIDVLDAWRGGVPAEQALTRWARGARYAGSKDRAAVRDHVFDALRRLGSAEALGGGTDGRSVMLGLARLNGVDPETLFTGVGHAPAVLTSAERATVSRMDDPPAPETDVPEWLRAPLANRVRGTAEGTALFAALCQRAPVWLRVALSRGGVGDARTALAAEGIETDVTDLCDTALRVTSGARALRQTQSFQGGLVELQDLSAQRAVAFVDWPATGRILDYCAGGGGKTLAIADRTQAELFAHDALVRRMADLPARARRAGAKITQVAPGHVPTDFGFDAVLCDVPCSGSGTWRRDPDAKWRLTPDGLAELLAQQAKILDTAAPMVVRGGQLIYMTCSLLRAENEDQVSAFLARQPAWSLERTLIDTPLSASDGFFTACLRRHE